MNDSIVCEKCNYDLFMICPDGLTVCNHCGEFSSFPTHSPTVPPAIVEPAQAVPVAHMRVMVGCRAPDDCEEYLDVCNPDDAGIDGKAFPVYREPPSIPAELRSKVLELCELTIINEAEVTYAMYERAKQIREMMGEA